MENNKALWEEKKTILTLKTLFKRAKSSSKREKYTPTDLLNK